MQVFINGRQIAKPDRGVMKKLFHYCPKDNSVIKNGIYSVLRADNEVLMKYAKRADSDSGGDILQWLEKSFNGRSRAVSCLTEPVVWKGNDPMLKDWVAGKSLFSFDLDELIHAGLVEAVYCKKESGANGENEIFQKTEPERIDFSPLSWHLCNKEKGLFFGVIRHYLVVMKNGFIPPEYLNEEVCAD